MSAVGKKLCVGILTPGDMGSGIARVLTHNGVDVITCLNGRSERTKALSQKAGIREGIVAGGSGMAMSDLMY